MRCVATRKPRAARRARSGLGPASWPADSSLAKQGCPGGPHRRARRPRAGTSAGPQARSGLGQTSRRAYIKLAVRQGCCSCRSQHGDVGNERAVLPSRAQRRRCPPRAAETKQSTIRSRKVVSRTNASHKQAHNNKSTTRCPGGWPALTLLECKAARPRGSPGSERLRLCLPACL